MSTFLTPLLELTPFLSLASSFFFFAGSHILSGAVIETKALDELLPNWKEMGAPVGLSFMQRSRLLPLQLSTSNLTSLSLSLFLP